MDIKAIKEQLETTFLDKDYNKKNRAKSSVVLVDNGGNGDIVLDVTTSAGSRYPLETSFTVSHLKKMEGTDFSSKTHAVFEDYSQRVGHSDAPKRLTAKAVSEAHSEALKVSLDKHLYNIQQQYGLA